MKIILIIVILKLLQEDQEAVLDVLSIETVKGKNYFFQSLEFTQSLWGLSPLLKCIIQVLTSIVVFATQ